MNNKTKVTELNDTDLDKVAAGSKAGVANQTKTAMDSKPGNGSQLLDYDWIAKVSGKTGGKNSGGS